MSSEMVKVDICCGRFKPEGFIGVDRIQLEGVDIVHNLDESFPFEDNSVDYLRAHDAIEHLPDKIKTMNEIWRVCKHGATVDIKVPSTDGRGAFQDPTHVSYWNIHSFYYYTSQHPDLYQFCTSYGFKGNFLLETIFDTGGDDRVIHTNVMMKVFKDVGTIGR
ncbi:MAG: methyltransferase domain-containing protein [Candidatus Margulisiibacteriota bacterium]